MFSWNTSNVFAIHEADSNGNILDEKSKPILYSVAKLNTDCACSSCGLSEMAITTNLDNSGSAGPFLHLKEERNWCGYNKCQLSINDSGNSTDLGYITTDCLGNLSLTNKYVDNLQISPPLCTFSCKTKEYGVSDASGNNSRL